MFLTFVFSFSKMGKIQGQICRLCLQKCTDFKAVEAYTKDVLDVLLLKINLAVSEEPIMCTNCAAMLMSCFDFKTTCFYAHDYIAPFLDDEKSSKLDLRKLYMSKRENVDIPEDHGVCGFCMELSEKCIAVSLNKGEKDVMLEKLIEKYLPELDLSTIDEPIICATCYDSLKTCFHFVSSCLIVEEKIMDYCKLTGAGIIKIADILQLTSRNVSNVKEGSTAIDVVSREGTFFDDLGNADGHKNGSFVHVEEQKLLPNENVELKTDQHDFDRYSDSNISSQPTTTKSRARKRVMARKEGPLKPSNKHKKARNVPEETIYQCHSCSFMTKYKKSLVVHTLMHKNPSEVPISKSRSYGCNSCSFRTKYKTSLVIHMVTHRDISETTMYQCDTCLFRTKNKKSLRQHLITHKDISEMPTYQCYSCSFKTIHKRSLTAHMLTHKNPMEVTMYQCTSCPHQTKSKHNLQRHLLVHKEPSEKKPYQCEACSYQSYHKESLQRHMITHKLSSETTVYQCHSCSFKTVHKYGLTLHMVSHKHPSEVPVYQCTSCPYQSKLKSNLNRHLLTHKGPLEIKPYQCDVCSFCTNQKPILRQHMITHKLPSETTMYQCHYCSLKTKYKYNLAAHLLTHKAPSEK